MNIVPTTLPYTYFLLRQNINLLKNIYPFLEVETVGKSVLGKNLYVLKLGNGPKSVFYSGSIHANEYITSILLMKFIEEYCSAFLSNSKLGEVSIPELYTSVTIYIMPMVNPDGVDLVTNAYINSYPYIKAQTIAKNFPEIPFPFGWKANIKGVDLNLQFPAMWDKAKEIKCEQGFCQPAPRDFVGYGPLTEPEAIAIYNFTLKHDFDLIIAYHTQGQEIYWNFQDIKPENGYEIGQQFANLSGYALTDVPYNSSFAGYKDWFIQNYKKPRLHY